jgi:hypothetical protein
MCSQLTPMADTLESSGRTIAAFEDEGQMRRRACYARTCVGLVPLPAPRHVCADLPDSECKEKWLPVLQDPHHD